MTTDVQHFSSEQTWLGGFYEIEFELGVPSDEQVALALQTLWSQPVLEGCYLSRKQEPQTQVRLNPRQCGIEGHIYGIAKLSNGTKAPCGTYVSRLQDEDGRLLRDFLAFYIPLGALARTYPVGGYPLSDSDQASTWRLPLDAWLVDLGRSVYERVPFALALIGLEVDFPNVTIEAIQRDGVPAERYDGFLLRVGDQLQWYPPTNFELIRTQPAKP